MHGAIPGYLARRVRSQAREGAYCVLLFFFALPLAAQTVRPVIVEYKEKAKARFEIANNTLLPLNVVLEPRSFDISLTGEPTFRPLDSQIHLKLSAMSFRIPPQQSYYVFFEAKADKLPAWFVIYCLFAGLPRQSGLNVQVELPHTVYLLQKEPFQKSCVQVGTAEFDPTSKRVLVEVQNQSSYLGRVQAAEVSSRHHKLPLETFPLLPQSRRRLESVWTAPEPPEKLVLRFRGFTIEKELLTRTP
jgi:hypothetical protein